MHANAATTLHRLSGHAGSLNVPPDVPGRSGVTSGPLSGALKSIGEAKRLHSVVRDSYSRVRAALNKYSRWTRAT